MALFFANISNVWKRYSFVNPVTIVFDLYIDAFVFFHKYVASKKVEDVKEELEQLTAAGNHYC